MRTNYVQCCSRHHVKFKPDRHFLRDRQQYRKKSRGIVDHLRPGRKRKSPFMLIPAVDTINKSETITDCKNRIFLLS
jgi:hypothetical protein